MLSRYYQLVKPGIVYGNMIHVIGGIGFAGVTMWSWPAAAGVFIGTALMIASGCVINNIFDRDIDAHMKRTQKRSLVQGDITVLHAAVFAAILGCLGFVTLVMLTNWLTVWLGIIAYVSYAFVYTYAKRVTVHSTVIGTLPGALPAVAGYTAMTGRLDVVALLLGLALVWWQLGHFYAIGVFRKHEYAAAGIRLLTHQLDEHHIRQVITGCIVMYCLTVGWLMAMPSAWLGGVVLFGAGSWWLIRAWMIRSRRNWARLIFFGSLVVTLSFAVAGAVNFGGTVTGIVQ